MSDNNNSKDKKATTTTRKKREFILTEDVKASTVKDIIIGILEINRHDDEEQEKDSDYVREPINLIVNTFGGSVYDGFALVAVIDTSETPVHTYLYGKAMSMGFIIFASGHRRFAHALATLMYHQISVGVHDKVEGIEQTIEQMKALQRRYDNYILSVSDVPQRQMDEAKVMKREWYMFADEAKDYGLVDEILLSKRSA